MEGSTLTRPGRSHGPGTLRRLLAGGAGDRSARLARAAFALVCLGFLIGFFVFPTYPVYDSYYALLWGHDLLHGQKPVLDGFRYPTEHPLSIFAGALLSLLGRSGDRIWVLMILASFMSLVAGIYKLGRIAATPLVGAIAAALLLTRFDYAFLAARGYVDIPYMALVVWAAVLEAARRKRGAPVLLMLAAAGLLRPEGWLLSAIYWCWLAWDATWPQRIRWALLAAIAPVVWFAFDGAITGDPLFSLHYTSSSAEDLGRQLPLSQVPGAMPGFFQALDKTPVLLAAIAGVLVGVAMAPRRMLMPLVLAVSGIVTFLAIGLAGASVIERYLAVSALALMVFAAVALGGWTMLERGRLRTAWMALASAAVLAGAAVTATHLNFTQFGNDLVFRGQAHRDLTKVLHDPKVQAGLRCGPLTAPSHKIVPDSRWVADLGEGRVLARAWVDRVRQDPSAYSAADRRQVASTGKGVAIVVTSRYAIFNNAWTNPSDDADIQLPPPGFQRVATSRFYAAYVHC